MLRTHLYYHIKPFVPRSLRLRVRQWFATRKRERVGSVWPVLPGSERPPEGWPGWPDHKRFAFVLSHDVEGQRGLDRVKQLAELEMSLGFRSSFNFIPEGPYSVPPALRSWLLDRGFEVGVHDLHHDGKLYASREGFRRKAERINRYLREWKAVGFRSGFMLHNLDWIRDLDVTYDASTFDTDPFEPQPDGVGTIFPFWVENAKAESGKQKAEIGERKPQAQCQPSAFTFQDSAFRSRSGYIELPYTLPQDSTLFLLLRETTPEIWNRKLDWIAEHGGMALVNVHPDYVDFDQGVHTGMEFPAQVYREFLQYVKEQYEDQCWHGLPREVARFAERFRPMCPVNRQRRIAMLAYTDYEKDARVVRYATALSKRGDRVEAVSRGPNGSDARKLLDGVTVHELGSRFRLRRVGPFSHLVPLLEFFFRSAVLLTKNHRRERYDLIHVHNIPEWLVFAVWVPRLLGVRILLDIHDLVPELYSAKFKRGDHAWVEPALRFIERISCRFSDHVIVSNHLWLNTIIERSMPESRCSVFFNTIDPDLFRPHPRTRQDEKKIVIFPGTLQWHQGVDIAIRAFPTVLKQVPEAEFHIYGDGGVIEELIALVAELGLEQKVLFLRTRPVAEIPQLIANADLGVVPKRSDSFGNQAYSTKIMEFMSQGVPAVISRTAIDQFYFNDSQVRFCESGNVQEFAEAMVEVLTNEELRQSLVLNAQAYVAGNHWGTRKQEYLDLVDRLIEKRDGGTERVVDQCDKRSERLATGR